MQSLPLDAHVAPPAAPARVAGRLDAVDVAKAIGIVLVVAGHAPGAPGAVLAPIYSFHMPLFFFLSGCLLSAERAALPWRSAALRGARTLLVPYLFFFVVSFGYWLATRHLGARAAKFAGVDAADAWAGLASGLSADLFVNITLWFLPCLFVCQLLHAAVRRVFGHRSGRVFGHAGGHESGSGAVLLLAVGVAGTLLAFTLPWSTRLPWGLDIAWIALPFYAAGHWLRVGTAWPGGSAKRAARAPWSALTTRPAVAAAWVIGTGVVWLAIVGMQGRVDLAHADFGPYPLLYLPCAAAGIALVMTLATRCPSNALLRWLAGNSLVIFALHPLLINATSGALQMAGGQGLAGEHAVLWWLASTAWGIAACVPIAALLRRHVPFALGLVPASGRRRGSA